MFGLSSVTFCCRISGKRGFYTFTFHWNVVCPFLSVYNTIFSWSGYPNVIVLIWYVQHTICMGSIFSLKLLQFIEASWRMLGYDFGGSDGKCTVRAVNNRAHKLYWTYAPFETGAALDTLHKAESTLVCFWIFRSLSLVCVLGASILLKL